MASTIVGLDIGTTGIRAVEVQDADGTRPRVLRIGETDLPEGAVVRGEVVAVQTVATSIRRLWASSKFGTRKVVLGIGNQNVLARDYRVPLISHERVRESLPFHVQDMLPVPVADALLDFYPAAAVDGETGPEADGLLIAAIKQAVEANVSAAEHARLYVQGVDLIPFALSRLLLTRGRESGSIAVVDFGASCTTFVVSIDGVPRFLRMIPSGGADITEAVRTRLEVDSVRAEALKRRVGLVGSVSEDVWQRARDVITEQIDELTRSLRNTVNYVASTHPSHPVGRIIVCGGGSRMPGLLEVLHEATGLPCEPADPFRSVAFASGAGGGDADNKKLALTVALGLAVGSDQ